MLRIYREDNEQTIAEMLLEENPDAKLIEGLDDALIGVQRRKDTLPVAVYDYWGCVSLLRESGVDYWSAIEYIAEQPDGSHDPLFIQLVDFEMQRDLHEDFDHEDRVDSGIA